MLSRATKALSPIFREECIESLLPRDRREIVKKGLTILVISSLFNTISLAASFDCGKAFTNVEKMICSDGQLSELDNHLMESYKKPTVKPSPSMAHWPVHSSPFPSCSMTHRFPCLLPFRQERHPSTEEAPRRAKRY